MVSPAISRLDTYRGLDTADTIFNDDFETGDLNGWDSAVTDSGDLSA